MSLNAVPISRRTAGYDSGITANGSYTLPRYAFIPHPSLQALGTGVVGAPGGSYITAGLANAWQQQHPYPVPDAPGAVYGVRVDLKSR